MAPALSFQSVWSSVMAVMADLISFARAHQTKDQTGQILLDTRDSFLATVGSRTSCSLCRL